MTDGMNGRCWLADRTCRRQVNRQKHGLTETQTGRQADGQTDPQTDRQAGRQTEMSACDLLVCMAFIHHNILEVGQDA